MLAADAASQEQNVEAAVSSRGKTVDRSGPSEAWKEIEAMRPPTEPAAWTAQPPSEDERRDFYRKQVEFACRATDVIHDFCLRFPDHEKAVTAMNLEARWMAPFKEEILEHRAERFEQDAARKHSESEAALLAEIERGAREMMAEFPDSRFPNQWLLRVARRADVAKARSLAAEVRDRKGLAEFVKEEARELFKLLDRVGKPVALKFTAVDGRAVDLQELKGRVVIIDFWATWCAPCVSELPRLKTAYDELHSQGFEVIGISFDERPENVARFLAEKKIPWPQFCDGNGWRNHFGMEFGVKSLPTLWLVDREGRLRDLNARSSLEEKVRKLLAEAHEARPVKSAY